MNITNGEKFCSTHANQSWKFPSGTQKERGYGSQWRKIARRIKKRDNHLCQQCLRRGVYEYGNEVDHIVPKNKGGTDADDNLQTLCEYCHRVKSSSEARAAKL